MPLINDEISLFLGNGMMVLYAPLDYQDNRCKCSSSRRYSGFIGDYDFAHRYHNSFYTLMNFICKAFHFMRHSLYVTLEESEMQASYS